MLYIHGTFSKHRDKIHLYIMGFIFQKSVPWKEKKKDIYYTT